MIWIIQAMMLGTLIAYALIGIGVVFLSPLWWILVVGFNALWYTLDYIERNL